MIHAVIVLMHVQVRRPNNYDYNIAITLGFAEPNPGIDLSQLDIVRTVVQDTPHKLFIGGLPCEWSEETVTSETDVLTLTEHG